MSATINKLIVFDLNNTLITGNIWEQFNSCLGVTKEQDQELYTAFAKSELTYDQWLTKLKKLYRLDTNKHSKAQVLDYLTQYDLKVDALSTLHTITEQGYRTLLLTGSFQMTADAVAFELGMTDAIATTKCLFDDQEMLYDLYSAGNERQAKVALLQAYCKSNDIQTENCIVIGSGGNNLELFPVVGESVTFSTSNQELQTAATHVVTDLHEVVAILSKL